MTNLAIKCRELEVPERDYFVSEIQTVYRLTDEEIDKFSNSTTAKIIAAIPFWPVVIALNLLLLPTFLCT